MFSTKCPFYGYIYHILKHDHINSLSTSSYHSHRNNPPLPHYGPHVQQEGCTVHLLLRFCLRNISNCNKPQGPQVSLKYIIESFMIFIFLLTYYFWHIFGVHFHMATTNHCASGPEPRVPELCLALQQPRRTTRQGQRAKRELGEDKKELWFKAGIIYIHYVILCMYVCLYVWMYVYLYVYV